MRIFVDRGGTFTDLVAIDAQGHLHVRKVLSGDPDRNDDAVVAGIKELVHTLREQPEVVHLGTTVATNALLTRRGAATALVMTKGLGDLAWIGDQTRPELFSLAIHRPEPLHALCIEASERVSVDGEVLLPLDMNAVENDLQRAREQGCEAVAICLLHGWQHPAHEQLVVAAARAAGFQDDAISCSSDLPIEQLVPRMQTLTVDASVTPVLQRSLSSLIGYLGDVPLRCMHSAGGLIDAAAMRGAQAVLSGPAGGVVGAAAVAEAAGVECAVTLDMGGTSTDVAWWDGTLERRDDTTISGLRIAVPALGVETIAAGGGSICMFDGIRLKVGPDSAGAHPGPACYGHGGPATITDCLIILGRLPAHALPKVFGTNRCAGADVFASRHALEQVHNAMSQVGAAMDSIEMLAQRCCDIAVEAMAAAVRRISTAQGRSIDHAALVAFGGAGGLLACPLADALGISQVLTHPLGGVLSAWGIGLARGRSLRRVSVRIPLHDPAAWEKVSGALSSDSSVHIHVAVPDWDRSVMLPASLLSTPEAAHDAFRTACLQRFGWDPGDTEPVITAVQVEEVEPATEVPSYVTNGQVRAAHETPIDGPQVIIESGSTVHIDAGWQGTVLEDGTLQIDRVAAMPTQVGGDDGTRVTLLSHRMQAIAEEMGALLRFTARSVNIRERLDYSCAIFTPEGDLIANGPHMPVHLGSMGASVRHVLDACPEATGPGDALVLNDPFRGGTHLPDLTVVTAVYDDQGERIAMIASRGHHSDIGGTTPGSMPPNATTLEEEGVVIDAFQLVRNGVLDEQGFRDILGAGQWPCRAPDRVLDDLRAQLAANQRGRSAVKDVAQAIGTTTFGTLVAGVLDQGEALVRRCIGTLHGGKACMQLDAGGAIVVRVQPEGTDLIVDFTGTTPQSTGNGNAPPAVTRAALLYVLRCLVNESIPLNDGCLRPVQLTLPEGSILSPRAGAAVAGGNVETSQLVVDALLSACSVQSASQGTMNNLAFGDDTVQHYETVCGGTGAGPAFDGAHCVQGHMTNSRLTDPEVLERRFAVRLWRLERRVASGGRGSHIGGDGVIRELECLQPMQVSLLSGRRSVSPPGLDGGCQGRPGAQRVVHTDGSVEQLPARFVLDAHIGDRIIIETPGGGGCGPQQ